MPIPQLRLAGRRHGNIHTPRSSAGEPRRPRRWLRRLTARKVLTIGLGLVFVFGIGVVGVFAYYSRDLPDPGKLLEREVAQSTRIYARDGTTLLYEIHGDERRTIIPLSDIPDALKHATIAIEDKDFYTHHGFSVTGFLRAAWVNVISAGRRRPGGSTITQQFVKNAILTGEKKLTRKIKELVLSFQMERKFTKDQILQLYLNEIPYGANNYGVQAAALSYFGKNVSELTLAESALLAALPQAPTYYSPYGNRLEQLSTRHHYILQLMADQRYITQEEADAAKAEQIVFQTKREAILAPHFVFYVSDLLSERYSTTEIERGGLKVVTTLDMDLQRIAEEEVKAGAEKNETQFRGENAALVALDVETGQILSMVGSRDYFDEEHDGNVNVVLRERNPGSSFKPFVYATLFEKGFTPETILYDVRTNFGDDGSGTAYIPVDYDGKERGPVAMRKALAGSLNIPAVKALYLATIPRVVDLANALGYTTFKPAEEYGLALALGGAGVRLLDHVGAFGTLAREGQRLPTSAILRVEDAKGKALEEFKPPEEQRVLNRQTARQVTDILSDNAARSFIFGSRNKLVLPDRPVATKTGTTNDWRDGWTIGFTPQLVAGVWVGNNDNRPMAEGADGSYVATPIWNAFMTRAHAALQLPAQSFKAPKASEAKKPILRGEIPTGDTYEVDRVTRKRIPSECRASWPAAFVDTITVEQAHSILHYVNPEDPDGPPPENIADDPMYKRWERGVATWLGEEFEITIPELESCSLRSSENLPTGSFLTPAASATVGTSFTASVGANGPQSITRVEYYLDDALLGSSSAAPSFPATLSTVGVGTGFHTLTAHLIDALENVGTISESINVATGSNQTLYFLEPKPGATAAAGTPLAVRAVAKDPAGVTTVALVERTNGTTNELQRVTNPGGEQVAFTLTDLAAGTHTLALTLVGGSGELTTDFLTITVGS
ncbi:MAG: PBP1A family penicillin-binding protein [Candidatus Kerfeldbacteria bacterium]|nr:PBP1A family penicillin-binding protein [Candidatus Kerfeldbacteria bacterium]